MKMTVTKEDLLRPHESRITDPEIRRFANRVGSVNDRGGDKPVDFTALNRLCDGDGQRLLEYIENLGKEPTP